MDVNVINGGINRVHSCHSELGSAIFSVEGALERVDLTRGEKSGQVNQEVTSCQVPVKSSVKSSVMSHLDTALGGELVNVGISEDLNASLLEGTNDSLAVLLKEG